MIISGMYNRHHCLCLSMCVCVCDMTCTVSGHMYSMVTSVHTPSTHNDIQDWILISNKERG